MAKPLKAFQLISKTASVLPLFVRVLPWKDDLCRLTGGTPRTIFFSLFTPNLSKVVNQDHLSSSQSSLKTSRQNFAFLSFFQSLKFATFWLWTLQLMKVASSCGQILVPTFSVNASGGAFTLIFGLWSSLSSNCQLNNCQLNFLNYISKSPLASYNNFCPIISLA